MISRFGVRITKFSVVLLSGLVGTCSVLTATGDNQIPCPIKAVRWEGGPLELARRQALGKIPQDAPKLIEAIRNWYSPFTVEYLVQAGFNSVWLTWSPGFSTEEETEGSNSSREYIQLCRQRGLLVMGVVSAGEVFLPREAGQSSRWTRKNPQGVPLPCQRMEDTVPDFSPCFRADLDNSEWRSRVSERSIQAIDAGANGIVLEGLSSGDQENASVEAFVREVSGKIKFARPSALVVPLLPVEYWRQLEESPIVALNEGTWPGVHPSTVTIEGGKVMIAGASRGPWIDLNLWLLNFAGFLAKERPVALLYQPDQFADAAGIGLLPEGSWELAIAEAGMLARSWVMSLDDGLRVGLATRDARVLHEWKTISAYQSFFTQHYPELQQIPLSNAAVIVDSHSESAETLNLLTRRGVQYRLLSRSDISKIDPGSDHLVVGVNLDLLPQGDLHRLLEYARAGAIVVTNSPNVPEGLWEEKKSDTGDSLSSKEHSVGNGKWIVYREAVSDPDEFSREVLKLIPFSERWIRFWNAPTVFARTAQAEGSTRRIVQLINYEIEPIEELQIQVKGTFKRIQVLSPDGPQTLSSEGLYLNPVNKDGFTEFLLPQLGIYSLLMLD